MRQRKPDKPATESAKTPQTISHRHAWRGTWDRPMNIDEDSHDPFTIARMTDRNVRGVNGKPDQRQVLKSSRNSTEQKKAKKAA